MANSILFGANTIVGESQIKKYTGILGGLLSGVQIQRKDKRGGVNTVNVPIKYGGANIRNQQLDDGEVKHGLNLPAMSYELESFTLDDTRVIANRPWVGNISPDDQYRRAASWTPRPYDFRYVLTIRANTIEEALLIAETIVVQFDPTVSLQVTDQRELGVERDINITLEGSPQFEDNYQESYTENRYVDITLTFTLKGFLYKPASMVGVVTETVFDFGDGDGQFVQGATNKEKETYLNKHSAQNLDKRLGAAVKKVTRKKA